MRDDQSDSEMEDIDLCTYLKVHKSMSSISESL